MATSDQTVRIAITWDLSLAIKQMTALLDVLNALNGSDLLQGSANPADNTATPNRKGNDVAQTDHD